MMTWYDMVIMNCCTLPFIAANMRWQFLKIGFTWKENAIFFVRLGLFLAVWLPIATYFNLGSLFVMEFSMGQVRNFVIGCVLNSAIMTYFWSSHRYAVVRR